MARRRSREINRLRQEVAETQHLAALGRLAGSVAHEVRNPLSALRGLVQYLAKGQPPDSQKAQYAAAAVEEVDRLERVVSGLLEYTRPRKPRQVPLDMEESINSTVAFMTDDPRASEVDIIVEVAAPLPPVQADPDQIRQVLVNLLVNALAALNGEGELRLKAFVDEGGVTVEVADNGPGLPPGDPGAGLSTPSSPPASGAPAWAWPSPGASPGPTEGELTAGTSEQGGALFSFHLPQGKSEL